MKCIRVDLVRQSYATAVVERAAYMASLKPQKNEQTTVIELGTQHPMNYTIAKLNSSQNGNVMMKLQGEVVSKAFSGAAHFNYKPVLYASNANFDITNVNYQIANALDFINCDDILDEQLILEKIKQAVPKMQLGSKNSNIKTKLAIAASLIADDTMWDEAKAVVEGTSSGKPDAAQTATANGCTIVKCSPSAGFSKNDTLMLGKHPYEDFIERFSKLSPELAKPFSHGKLAYIKMNAPVEGQPDYAEQSAWEKDFKFFSYSFKLGMLTMLWNASGKCPVVLSFQKPFTGVNVAYKVESAAHGEPFKKFQNAFYNLKNHHKPLIVEADPQHFFLSKAKKAAAKDPSLALSNEELSLLASGKPFKIINDKPVPMDAADGSNLLKAQAEASKKLKASADEVQKKLDQANAKDPMFKAVFLSYKDGIGNEYQHSYPCNGPSLLVLVPGLSTSAVPASMEDEMEELLAMSGQDEIHSIYTELKKLVPDIMLKFGFRQSLN